MKQITAVLVGAGSRGVNAYASYALNYPNELSFVAVAEPDEYRREQFAKQHNIPKERCFSSWEPLLEQPRLADAILICTQDDMHFEPTMAAIEKKYDILLEKPMSPSLEECIIMADRAKQQGCVLSICHVLRYTPFFTTLKQLLDDGEIGRLMCIQHNENVGYFHQAHSFVRGNWNNSKLSSPMILAKCCHDMDILYWLAGAECKNVASFGHLTHFKAENAPAGAPERCLDGCPAEQTCPYHVSRQYLTSDIGWPTCNISNDLSLEGRIKALKETDYGRCVYRSNNDVVDHQSVSLEFENEVTASFTMSAFTNKCCRTIKLMGEKGEIRGHMENNVIEVTDFLTQTVKTIQLAEPLYGHGGGDVGIMRDFVRLLQQDNPSEAKTSGSISVHSHLMSFAAEHARVTRQVVNLEQFQAENSGK